MLNRIVASNEMTSLTCNPFLPQLTNTTLVQRRFILWGWAVELVNVRRFNSRIRRFQPHMSSQPVHCPLAYI